MHVVSCRDLSTMQQKIKYMQLLTTMFLVTSDHLACLIMLLHQQTVAIVRGLVVIQSRIKCATSSQKQSNQIRICAPAKSQHHVILIHTNPIEVFSYLKLIAFFFGKFAPSVIISSCDLLLCDGGNNLRSTLIVIIEVV